MSGRYLLKGTLVLTTANLFNRLIGLINQVLALRIMGTEGYGLYQLAIPIYLLALVLTTTGIPVAVVKMVAEERASGNLLAAYQLVRWSAVRLATTGLLFTLLIGLLLPFLGGKIMADPRAAWCLLILIPTLPLTAISSILRGYFQGMHQMTIPAIAQMIEQMVRVFTGLYLATQLAPRGLTWAVMGYAAGVLIGEATGFLLLLGCYVKGIKTPLRATQGKTFCPVGPDSLTNLTGRIWDIAGPVTFTRISTVLLLNFEAILIPHRLQALGHSLPEATALYGLFTGVALTLISIPNVLTSAISTNLLPVVSAAWARKDLVWLKHSLPRSLRYTVLAGLPLLVILWVRPDDITRFIFNLSGAVKPIRILTIGGLFLYIIQTTNGILYGLGQARRVLGNSLILAGVRLGAIYTLTISGNDGLNSVALAYLLSYVSGAALNLFPLIRQFLAINLQRDLIVPLLAALAMGLTISQTWPIIYGFNQNPLVLLMLSFIVGMLCYLIILYKGKALKEIHHIWLITISKN